MRIRDLVRWLRLVPHRARAQRDLDDEMRLHVDLIERQLRGQGLHPDAARVEARRRFGNRSVVREDARDAVGLRWFDDLRHDCAHALRALAKDRRFAASGLVTLALGIGATTAIFSAVSSLVFRPLPLPEPERLVQIFGTSPLGDEEALNNYGFIREQATSFVAGAGLAITAPALPRGGGGGRRSARAAPGASLTRL